MKNEVSSASKSGFDAHVSPGGLLLYAEDATET